MRENQSTLYQALTIGMQPELSSVLEVMRFLYQQTEADYILFGRFTHNGRKAQTLNVLSKGELSPYMLEYEVAGTPCADIYSNEVCYYPGNIQQLFPSDDYLRILGAESYVGIPVPDSSLRPSGFVALMHHTSIDQIRYVEQLLQALVPAFSYFLQPSAGQAKQQNASTGIY